MHELPQLFLPSFYLITPTLFLINFFDLGIKLFSIFALLDVSAYTFSFLYIYVCR